MANKKTIRDLIIEVFQEKNKPLPGYLIHKILFLYKVNIREKNSLLANNLPFYWYRYGEYSEPIAECMTELQNEGILTATPLKHHYKLGNLYTLNKIKLGTYSSNLDSKDVDELKKIVHSVDESMGGEFNKELYVKYAPYEFQILYNKTYLDSLNEIAYTDITLKTNDINELVDTLIDSESKLVSNQLFDDFNRLFSSYFTTAYRIFKYYKEEHKDKSYLNKSYLKDLAYISQKIWFVFVDGIRIMDDAHDEYYNGRINIWKELFEKDIIDLEKAIKAFNKTIKVDMGGKGRTSLSKDEKEILSSVIDGYFS